MLKLMEQTAREAGKLILKRMGTLGNIVYKSNPKDLVTIADHESEEYIIKRLLDVTPGYKILAEESGITEGSEEYTWIIDPIDGTKNFAHSLPIFSISIALAKGKDVICGIIYGINDDEMFSAEIDKKAYCNGERIFVSKTDKVNNALLATGFPYIIEENPDFCLERFIKMVRESGGVRRLGSAALDCAYTACGRFDGFWEVSLNSWDVAAGILLIEEAGGCVTPFDGKRRSSVFDKQFLASNGLLHNELVRMLEEAKRIQIKL